MATDGVSAGYESSIQFATDREDNLTDKEQHPHGDLFLPPFSSCGGEEEAVGQKTMHPLQPYQQEAKKQKRKEKEVPALEDDGEYYSETQSEADAQALPAMQKKSRRMKVIREHREIMRQQQGVENNKGLGSRRKSGMRGGNNNAAQNNTTLSTTVFTTRQGVEEEEWSPRNKKADWDATPYRPRSDAEKVIYSYPFLKPAVGTGQSGGEKGNHEGVESIHFHGPFSPSAVQFAEETRQLHRKREMDRRKQEEELYLRRHGKGAKCKKMKKNNNSNFYQDPRLMMMGTEGRSKNTTTTNNLKEEVEEWILQRQILKQRQTYSDDDDDSAVSAIHEQLDQDHDISGGASPSASVQELHRAQQDLEQQLLSPSPSPKGVSNPRQKLQYAEEVEAAEFQSCQSSEREEGDPLDGLGARNMKVRSSKSLQSCQSPSMQQPAPPTAKRNGKKGTGSVLDDSSEFVYRKQRELKAKRERLNRQTSQQQTMRNKSKTQKDNKISSTYDHEQHQPSSRSASGHLQAPSSSSSIPGSYSNNRFMENTKSRQHYQQEEAWRKQQRERYDGGYNKKASRRGKLREEGEQDTVWDKLYQQKTFTICAKEAVTQVQLQQLEGEEDGDGVSALYVGGKENFNPVLQLQLESGMQSCTFHPYVNEHSAALYEKTKREKQEEEKGVWDSLHRQAMERVAKKKIMKLQAEEDKRQKEVDQMKLAKAYSLMLRSADGHGEIPKTEAELKKKVEEMKLMGEEPMLTLHQVDQLSRRLSKPKTVDENAIVKKVEKEMEECTFHPWVHNSALASHSAAQEIDGNSPVEVIVSECTDRLYGDAKKRQNNIDEKRNLMIQRKKEKILAERLKEDHHFSARVELDPSLKEKFMDSLEVVWNPYRHAPPARPGMHKEQGAVQYYDEN